MKKILLLLSFIISMYANDDLEKQREIELKMYSNSLNIQELSNDCKIALKDIIKKTIDYNMNFDNYIKDKGTKFIKSLNEAEDNVEKSKTYFITICTKNDLKLIKELNNPN